MYATKPENKNKTQQQVADYFNQQNPGLHIDRSTISKILGKKAKWLALAIGLWVENANANNLPVSEMIIKEKAFYFAQEFNIPRENMLFSNGWIEKFKIRNNIRCYRLHGEANSAPLETLFEERRKLQPISQDYTLDNIFNADKTDLFFRMAPNQTLASAPTPGTKLDKTHITVLLATNAIGTQKLKPLVIAWMRSDIFGEWLEYVNNKFQAQSRKFLLLIDNASSYFNPDDDEHNNENLNLSHVIIHQFEMNVDLESNKINVKEVMEYVAQSLGFTLIAQEMANQEDQERIELLLQQYSSFENVSVKSLEEINQYLEMVDLTIPTEQPLTDAEIIQLISEEENEKTD
ncbi:tigger transposable element-derived protein 6-like [Rhizophagus clarus]|uniref:Tigger transposable element-derived protein 6-like n=1 Tax=Rhizophagus clarus TaxID=94130 RepID=A0A8H3MGF1_9GLOM|nr:tigger transposable element-derived protein 6-like [Rhizophagus clarus]